MRRAVSILSIYLLVLATTPGFATSGAHFFHDTTDSVSQSGATKGALVITIDEAGVGQQDISYSVTVNTATATYACINGGGNHPQASNKETVSKQLSLPLGTFSPINGRVQVSVTLAGTPLPKGDFSCPSGQSLVLAGVSYSGITLTDTTNNVSTGLADTGATFFNI